MTHIEYLQNMYTVAYQSKCLLHMHDAAFSIYARKIRSKPKVSIHTEYVIQYVLPSQ